MKKIIAICIILSTCLSGLSQNTLFGNGGYNIQTYKFYLNSSTDSLARFAKWGAKLFTSLTIVKDSVTKATSIGSREVVLHDTATGKIERGSVAMIFNQAQRDSSGYYTITGTTTDATPTNIAVIPMSIGYTTSIESTCIAITADGDDGLSGIKHRAYHRSSGGTLTSMAPTTIAADSYVGGGLSTATFTLTNSGTDAAIQVTGEAATTINWKIRYKLVSINVSF